MLEDTVSPAKATLMSTGTIRENQVEQSNVALPGIIRAGLNGTTTRYHLEIDRFTSLMNISSSGEQQFGSGTMQPAQFGGVVGRVSEGHLPVSVSRTIKCED